MLKDKVIILTGAAGILGQSFTKALFEEGAIVVIADLKIDDCRNLKNKLAKESDRLFPLELDITKLDSIKVSLGEVLKKYKKIDGLVNNAVLRVPADKSFFDRSVEELRKTEEVNFYGLFSLTQAVAKIMVKQKFGSIVNIGSIYGVVGNDQSLYKGGFANYDYYCFEKGGLVNFSRYLASLLGRYNIRVNTLSLGGVADKTQDKEFVKNYSAKTPLNRLANAEELGGPLAFLLSDKASYVTGHNFIVDGGFTAI